VFLQSWLVKRYDERTVPERTAQNGDGMNKEQEMAI